MRSVGLLVLSIVLVVPAVAATPPSPPLDLAMRIDGTPTLHEPFAVTVGISAHIAVGNVTVDLVLPTGWEKDPVGNRTLYLREQDDRSLAWRVTPKSDGFWTIRAELSAYGGGMTSWTQYFGLLHGNLSLASARYEEVMPVSDVHLQFRAIEESPANVTLIAVVTPRSSWMKHGMLRAELGILNESRIATGPGGRALTGTLTGFIPPYYGARAWSQFIFEPHWGTPVDPDHGRPGLSLGCRDLQVTRESAPSLDIGRSRDCEQVRSHLAPGPGVAALVLLGITAAWVRRRAS